MGSQVDSGGGERVELAGLIGRGRGLRKTGFDPAPLRAARIPEPDLKHATRLEFLFQNNDAGKLLAAADDVPGGVLGSLCLSSRIFWSINGKPWPDREHGRLPPPLAILKRGGSYVFVLKNDTPFMHPIHIHGHTFKILRSNKQHLPPHHADTLLLLPDEQLEAAFVADNPGDWMFHCHIIEHQETGMMGYLRVV